MKSSKTFIVIIIAFALCFTLCSCAFFQKTIDPKIIMVFKFGESLGEVMDNCSDQIGFGASLEYNYIAYKQNNVPFFKDDYVIVTYYFDDDGLLSRVRYSIEDCKDNNVENFLNFIRKNYDEEYYGSDNMNGMLTDDWSYTRGEWKGDGVEITYEYLYKDPNSSIRSFNFKMP